MIRLLFIVISMLLSSAVQAQILTGTVIDKHTQEGLSRLPYN